MKINKLIDHTVLKAFATSEDITKLCKEALEYDFASVCVNPANVSLASSLLKDSDVLVCTVIGFPLGAATSAAKAFETEDAIFNGADEIDMVINEEGKYIEGLKPEIAVISKEGNAVLDLVMGSCVFVSHDDAGNTVDLNDKQIEIVMEELKLQTELYNPKEEKSFITKVLFV